MTGKVAIITGGSQGIGAGLAAAYRARGWAVVVVSAHAILPSQDPDLLTVAADIAEPAAGALIVDAALERFGRIDTLVNNAGVFISKPFTEYTAEDYALMVGVNLTGFFWLTQRVIAEMATRYGGHVVSIMAALAEYANSGDAGGTSRADQGRPGRGHQVAGRRVRPLRHPGQRRLAGRHHPCTRESYDGPGDRLPPPGRGGQVSDVVDGVLFLESSPDITGEILHLDGGQVTGR